MIPSEMSVSIVIPCRNEQAHIGACLQSLLEQAPVPGGFEVIVADGMSDDGTREILKKFSVPGGRITTVDNPRRTTACGMNAGIRQARGQYIAILGAHNRYAPDYLRASLAVMQETGADNVGGSMVCSGDTRLQKAIAAAHHSPFSAGGARWHDPDYEGPADTVFGGFYRREVFEKIGLFDETFIRNQDDEFNLRLTRAGGRIWQSPKIASWYSPRASLSGLFSQYFQYGFWKVAVIRKHRLPASWRHLVPGSFVLANIVLLLTIITAPWTGLGWWSLPIWQALILTYGVVSLGATFLVAKEGNRDLLPFLPLVFAIYHLAYGLGSITGLVCWPLKNQHAIRVNRLFTEINR